MKTNLRNFIFILYTVVSGMILLTGNAHAADDTSPPEVKALIGTKFPPEENPGDVPGWLGLWGSGIIDEMYFDVLQQGKVTILAIKTINRKDKTTSILDARVIPGSQLQFYMKNGKLEWKKNEMQMYRIRSACWRDSSENKEIIIGMWRYEPGSKCTDSSTLVKKAWLLNPESGRLTDISTKDVSCREPDCGED